MLTQQKKYINAYSTETIYKYINAYPTGTSDITDYFATDRKKNKHDIEVQTCSTCSGPT